MTLSAMPSEKLRPRQPEVAMPRTGEAASTVEAAVERRRRSGRATGSAQTPTS